MSSIDGKSESDQQVKDSIKNFNCILTGGDFGTIWITAVEQLQQRDIRIGHRVMERKTLPEENSNSSDLPLEGLSISYKLLGINKGYPG